MVSPGRAASPYHAAVAAASRACAVARFVQRERAGGRDERQQQAGGEQNQRHGKDLSGDRNWVATTTPWALEERNTPLTSFSRTFAITQSGLPERPESS